MTKQDLKDFEASSKYDYFDWYDYDKVEKLQEKRARQWLKIYGKIMDTEEKGDSIALAKAQEALRVHEQQDSILKKKAAAAGYYWF